MEVVLNAEEPYRVNLPVFEGPLDLLLYLIKKDELDIWDIPIARITEEYLAYLDMMGDLNLSVAGEFLLMASMLAAIKSRMLIASQTLQETEEIEDPRAPLVQRLLEYQRFRDVAEALQKGVLLNRDVFQRGSPALNIPGGVPKPLPDVGLFDLMTALKDVLSKVRARELVHHISPERFSVVDRIHWLHDLLRSKGSIGFRALFSTFETRMEIILTFLAMLEMLKANIVTLVALEGGAKAANVVGRSEEDGTDGESQEDDSAAEEARVLDWAICERDPGVELEMTFEEVD